MARVVHAVILLLLAAQSATVDSQILETIGTVSAVMTIVDLTEKFGLRMIDLNQETSETTIINGIKTLGQQVDDAALRTTGAVAALVSAQQSIGRYELRLKTLVDQANQLDTLYKQMMRYVSAGNFQRHTLEDFAREAVSHGQGSIRSLVDAMHRTLMGSGELELSIFQHLKLAVKDMGNNVCALEHSHSQLIYDVYNLAAVAELKGLAVMHFSWILLKKYLNVEFKTEAALRQNLTQQSAIEKSGAARRAMEGASRSIWRCDPSTHVEGTTFVQLTRLLQGYVRNEEEFNAQRNCETGCDNYKQATENNCLDSVWDHDSNKFCHSQKCGSGRVFNCENLSMLLGKPVGCVSKDPNRRYDYVTRYGTSFGDSARCSTSEHIFSIKTHIPYCQFCFCICDDDGRHSDRYFSLRPVVSDTVGVYVIVGARFVKVNRVVHLQIKQAKLLPGGKVNAASAHWKPVDAFQLSDARPNIDYFKMSYENRTLSLEDVVAPPRHLLTGLKLEAQSGTLRLSVRHSPVNLGTGAITLTPSLNNWSLKVKTGRPPTMTPYLDFTGIPTKSSQPSELQSTDAVEFTHSDRRKDAAQTTVPFIDAQSVEPNLILSGAGLYHKFYPGFGGFVGIRLITYDWSDFLPQ